MYIDDGGGSSAPTQSIMDSMNAFAQTAAAGGFEVSQQGGDALIGAIDDFLQWVADNSDRVVALQQARKLGTSSGAQTMAPFLQEVVMDNQGFATQLLALRDSLVKAREGIVTAMGNYRRTEEAATASFKNI
jgi:hypothetical protein